jgi:hypothetical protein
MPPRRPNKPILAVLRTQHTPSSEPDDEDSTLDPRQTSGSSHPPEVTREPSDNRSSFNMLYDLLKQQSEDIDRLRELVIKKYLVPSPNTPSHADLASPPPAVEDPENSDINLNEHSYDRSAQEEVSAPPPGDTPSTSIQGEDPKDPRDKMIPIQGMVSRTENLNTMPITTNFTTVPKTTVTNLPVQTQDRSGESEYQPTEIDNKPVKVTNEPAKRVLTTDKLLGSTAIINEYNPKGGNIRSIMTKGYAYMHARRPHVLALQGIG